MLFCKNKQQEVTQMENMSKLLADYRKPLQELIERQDRLDVEQLQQLTAWQRSTYREVLKFKDKEQQ